MLYERIFFQKYSEIQINRIEFENNGRCVGRHTRKEYYQAKCSNIREPPRYTKSLCLFCRKNDEPESVYSTHQIKDAEGNITCPTLAAYKCRICGATGQKAHTVRHCPENKKKDISKVLPISSQRSHVERIRSNAGNKFLV